MVNNPYIDLVKKHAQIMCDTDEIYTNKTKWNKYFKNDNDIVLEVGTWLGNFFSREISKNPNNNFVWMEIKYKRLYITAEKSLWNLNNYANNWVRPKWILRKKKWEEDVLLPCSWEGVRTEERGFANTSEKVTTDVYKEENNSNFVVLKDKAEHIVDIFWEGELSLSYIFFPDPWSKKKRWLKNRLLQENFLNNLFTATKTWWKAIIKTDHLDYFNFILEEISKTSWKIVKQSFDWESEQDFDNTETTEFQQLFRWQEIKINYVELAK